MNWNFVLYNTGTGQQDLRVAIALKSLRNSYAETSEQMIEIIKNELREVPRANNFSAELMYKVYDEHGLLNIRKCDAKGNAKKLFATFIKKQPSIK